ncbi:MAG: 2-dehydropantoate 2-reductase [Acidiferrobacterales bacterium]|nr:2-dehydropantoate 2-reductase [Acidiferrobacterales bacterium]
MKICVVGAGSMGGMMGVKFHNIGEDVTLVARGPHRQAMEANNGLKLIMNDGTVEFAQGIKTTSDIRSVGEQDLVILGVKAHQIAPIVDDINTLLGENTILLTIQNGILWWYFQLHGGEFNNRVLQTVDPGGSISRKIDPRHIIGSISYPAAEISEPGVIRHIEGIRMPVGEIDGVEKQRTRDLCDLLNRAGFKSVILESIRAETWLKVLGNLSFNPVSALTHSTLVDICQFPPSRDLIDKMMSECREVALRLGVGIRLSNERRIEGAEKVGKHKTSMLQDVEVGKALELEALIGAVIEIASMTGTKAHHIESVYALVQLLNHMMQQDGLYVQARPLGQ